MEEMREANILALEYLEPVWEVYIQYSTLWMQGNTKTKTVKELEKVYDLLSPLRSRLRYDKWEDEQECINQIARLLHDRVHTLRTLGTKPSTFFKVRGGEPSGQEHTQNLETTRKNAAGLIGVLCSYHLRKCKSPRE